jgi:hypothetical protein
MKENADAQQRYDKAREQRRNKYRGNGSGVTPGVTLDDFRAYMLMHNYIFAPTGDLWPASSVNARIPPIMEGKKLVLASTWLDKNKPVEQMTWAPGEPAIITGKMTSDGGWIARNNHTVFNLYRPPLIEPGNAAEADRRLDHINKIYPEHADHIVKWCAHRVQRPQEKINHALVFGGAQGIGKDSLLEPVKRAVGPWNFQEVSPQQMLGRFNGYLKSVVLRISEARDLGEVNRFQFYDHMKAYTAAPPDVLRCDEKNLREAASSSPAITRRTASTCQPTIVATLSPGRTSPRTILSTTTGPAFGTGTITAAIATSRPTSPSSTRPNSTRKRRHPRRPRSGTSSTQMPRPKRANWPTSSKDSVIRTQSPSRRSSTGRRTTSPNGSGTAETPAEFRIGSKTAATSWSGTNPPKTDAGRSADATKPSTEEQTCRRATASPPPPGWLKRNKRLEAL